MHKKRIGQVIADVFDVPLEGISSVPNAQLIGNSILNIDGCLGVKKYENDEIILRCKDFLLTVIGESLSMITFSQGRVSIRGSISIYKTERV